MTIRAGILGLFAVVFMCGMTFFNDVILRQTAFIGHHFPPVVYAGLIATVLLLPLAVQFRRRFALSSGELAVILGMGLVACAVPGSGLMRTFSTSVMLPHHHERLNPGWRDPNVLDLCPSRLLANPAVDEDAALNGFVQGLSEPGVGFGVADVPWQAWSQTLLFWMPLVVTFWIALVALALIVHHQWHHNELLPYPVAQFTTALMPDSEGKCSSLFSTRGFQLAAGAVLVLHLVNFSHVVFPSATIPIRREFDFAPLVELFPFLSRGGAAWLLRVTLHFTVIGLAYFVPCDVSFSLGLGPVLWAAACGAFAAHGMDLEAPIQGMGGYLSRNPRTFLLFGANLAVFGGIVYSGRHGYWHALKRAVGRPADAVPSASVWGVRVLACAVVFAVAQLWAVGLRGDLALLYVGVFLVVAVVMGRVFAETGLFFSHPYVFPCVVIWGLMGSAALGPQALLILFLLTTVLCIDPREALMPFVINALAIFERQRVKPLAGAGVLVAGLLVGLLVAVPVTLRWQYERGYAKWCHWTSVAVPQMAPENAVAIRNRLLSQGAVEGGGRAQEPVVTRGSISPDPTCVVSLAVGAVLAAVAIASRLRWSWWPIHPVLFLTWSTYPGRRLYASFLIGCIVKSMIVRFGGHETFSRLKPVFFGLIAGEILGAAIPCIIAIVYYLVTGGRLPAYSVLGA